MSYGALLIIVCRYVLETIVPGSFDATVTRLTRRETWRTLGQSIATTLRIEGLSAVLINILTFVLFHSVIITCLALSESTTIFCRFYGLWLFFVLTYRAAGFFSEK